MSSENQTKTKSNCILTTPCLKRYGYYEEDLEYSELYCHPAVQQKLQNKAMLICWHTKTINVDEA